MSSSKKGSAKNDNPSTGSIADQLMKNAREQVARQFMQACGNDRQKRGIVQELSQNVLGYRIEVEEESLSEHTDDGCDENDAVATKMEEIVVYPYEEETNAEVKEQPFDDFKALLKPASKNPEQFRRRQAILTPTKEAVAAFGKGIAERVVLAYHHISKAGQIYSEAWLAGDIRDVQCGAMEPSLLLMCLQEQKLATASHAVLAKICEDLKLAQLVKSALEKWGVVDTFPKLAECKNVPFEYESAHRKQCQQCEIYVARAYVCRDSLSYDVSHDDLAFKLMSCFEMMDDNLLTESTNSPSKRNENIRQGQVQKRRSPSSTSATRINPSEERTRSPQTTQLETLDSRIIEKIDLDTLDVVGRYNSVTEAANSVSSSVKLNSSKTGIHKVLKRLYRSCGGFFWCYEGDSRKPPLKPRPNSKVTKIEEATGKIVAVYNSTADCQRENGATIFRSLMSGQSIQGFCYRYVLESSHSEHESNQGASPKMKATNADHIWCDTESSDASSVETDKGESDQAEVWPYDEYENAEKGEKAFDEFKAFFKPDTAVADQFSRRMNGIQSSRETIECFGEETAQNMVLAYRQIRDSKIAYSSTWQTGVIHDVSCGPLAKPILLMCLQEERLSGATKSVLGKLIQELESGKLVQGALRDWDIEKSYAQLVRWKKLPFQYASKARQQCQQCEIFVARTRVCMEYVNSNRFERSIKRKILSCLKVMDQHLLVHSRKSKEDTSQENRKSAVNASIRASGEPSKKQAANRLHDSRTADGNGGKVAESSARKLSNGKANHKKGVQQSKRKAPSEFQQQQRAQAAKLKEERSLQSRPTPNADGGHQAKKSKFSKWASTQEFVEKRNLPSVSKSVDTGLGNKGTVFQFPENIENGVRYAEQCVNLSGNGLPSLKAITALDEVEESPYLHDQSAEVGEEMFSTFKGLLEPKDDAGPTNEAIKAFGSTLAESLVKAGMEILRSGMVYGSSWKDGEIQATRCGLIPRHMILLCLQEQRLAKSSDELPIIITDLGVCGIVVNAITVWRLEEEYPLFCSFSNLSRLHSKKHSVLRCLIFVARTYRCMVALKRKSIDYSLMQKVKACLRIVHASLERKVDQKQQRTTAGIRTSSSHDSDDADSILRPSVKIVHNLFGSPKLGVGSSSGKAHQASIPRKLMRKEHVAQESLLSVTSKSSIVNSPPQARDARAVARAKNPAQTSTVLTTPKGKVVQLPTLYNDEQPIGPWYPDDENELILNPIEAELAWLAEESIFSLRSEPNDIQWDFVWQYASPALKIELRRIPDESGSRLAMLARLDDALVRKRFDVLRIDIRRKLNQGLRRTMMKSIIPLLRHATRV